MAERRRKTWAPISIARIGRNSLLGSRELYYFRKRCFFVDRAIATKSPAILSATLSSDLPHRFHLVSQSSANRASYFFFQQDKS